MQYKLYITADLHDFDLYGLCAKMVTYVYFCICFVKTENSETDFLK